MGFNFVWYNWWNRKKNYFHYIIFTYLRKKSDNSAAIPLAPFSLKIHCQERKPMSWWALGKELNLCPSTGSWSSSCPGIPIHCLLCGSVSGKNSPDVGNINFQYPSFHPRVYKWSRTLSLSPCSLSVWQIQFHSLCGHHGTVVRALDLWSGDFGFDPNHSSCCNCPVKAIYLHFPRPAICKMSTRL